MGDARRKGLPDEDERLSTSAFHDEAALPFRFE